MLTLVVADRYLVCVVQDDVGDLEHGVVEQPRADGFLSLALFLELRHPAQLPDRRDTVQQPRQFGVRAYVALNEQDAPGGVEPGSHEDQRGTACAAGRLRRGRGEGSGGGGGEGSRGASWRGGRRRSRWRRAAPGRPPSAGPPRRSCPDASRRSAGSRRKRAAWSRRLPAALVAASSIARRARTPWVR